MDKQTNDIIKHAGGDVIKVIQLEGEVLEGETLDNLKQQTGDITQFDTLVLEIASPGGSVSEGLATMVWLEDMSKQGKHIVTVVTANAYSIASLIMLVADIKLISTHAKVMVHNPMVPLLEYVNANDLQEYIDSLRSLEDTMYQLYEFFTGLDIEQIKLLMDNETYLLPQEAVDKGFADMVVDIKPKSYSTASNIKKEINMSNTLNILNKVIGMVNKSEFINQLYSDLEGNEIEIFQKDASTYKVGDRTSMIEGEVLLSDGAKLTVVASEITDINRSAEEVSTATEAVAVEVTEDVVVEDVVATEVATEEVVEVVAKEIVTEEVVIDEVVAVEAVAEVKEEVVIEKMEMPEMVITQEHMDSMHVVIAQLDARVVALERMCMGYDMKLEAISKFENIATEAIDTLATNTVSNFKPEAVSSPSKSTSGSIFNQLKGKRGLK